MAADPVQFAAGVLRGIGAPVNRTNIAAFIGWSKAEGPLGGNSWARNNPLNTTLNTHAATGTINSAGVKAYRDAEAGIQATVQTLRNGNYGGILQAFREANPGALGRAVVASPWGTGALAEQTIAQTSPSEFKIGNIPSGPVMPSASNRGGRPSLSPSTETTQVGGGVNWSQAGTQALLEGLNTPINTTGKVTAGPDLAGLLASAASNPANITAPHSVTTRVPGSLNPVGQASIGGATGQVSFGSAKDPYGNPIPRGVVRWERTDEGVDAALTVGTAIRAVGDARVAGIVPNWFSGQPLVYYQLLNGPDKGRYIYVAEQITPTVRPGQIVHAGDVIARYAANGTGIETGWASPSGEPTAHGTYTEGQVTSQGLDFRHFLDSLGAHA